VRFQRRIPWLLGLMQVQSISSVVLEEYTDIIEPHLNVSAFLTMALGTGGTVGGQAVAEIIKALRAGDVRRADFGRLMREELMIGSLLGLTLFCAAFVRVMAFGQCDLIEALTVAAACFCLVTFTSLLAPALTLGLSLCRMETAGAPPTLMVLVDLIGTFIVCQLVKLTLHSRMVDQEDMTKGYVWTFEDY
jgi:Mg/Co/Ni transporter MgtE